ERVGVGLAGLDDLAPEGPDLRPVLDGRGTDAHVPVAPSIDSRIRSAWPLCRAYSSTMCARIQRRLIGSPRRPLRAASSSSDAAAETTWSEASTNRSKSARSSSGLAPDALCQSQSG